ncbi:MAG: Eco57I restriction-modification methylase domain-containing protein [Gammaproteobacteria bacterium]|nr:Eco57I restriction-modification methylase domain-containing protein [Gammaproteobacteria bacterium]
MVAKHCRSGDFDGALAAYYDDQGQWRFSFISMEYRLDETGKLKSEESPSKRFTYLLGREAKVRTAKERFNRLSQSSTLNDLKAAFAVEQLNEEFYKKLYQWYEDAKTRVVYPNDEQVDSDMHRAVSLIRLLTRLLFVWFLKEKKLVNPVLFDLEQVQGIIHWDEDSSYYKSILQNLFFATLNREITGEQGRTFRATENGNPDSGEEMGNVYRYWDLFRERNEPEILKWFEQTPFLNGGLFECLDRVSTDGEKAAWDRDNRIRMERNTIRTDGFSERDDNPLSIPNELFFNDNEAHPGLIQLLGQYQFTVEESTPLDMDVALDPELLGRVFENLLASYNPETRETARRASGSYYTPREIVHYMVDESLKAYFTNTCGLDKQKIHTLFRVGSEHNNLSEDEIAILVSAIEKIRVIDPAVGSGAFPMGMLQRLVQILGMVDPENNQWKQRQLEVIGTLPDPESRRQARKEIETIFSEENRFNDFGRKLYLIEQCIYGVDIQPIAVQIAKLRFFISLVIEQHPTEHQEDNYGIKPLPNLETRLIAADSLIGQQLEKRQHDAGDAKLKRLRKELNEIRRNYFNAKTAKTKTRYREEDTLKRNEIANALYREGATPIARDNARKIACWEPYNQNTSADWFEPEWMFGVTEGFDIVLGNPPYIQLQKDRGKLSKQYRNSGYQCFVGTGDIYQLFYERACQLLKPQQGLLCFITSNSWLKAKYGKKLRRLFSEHHTPLKLLEMGKGIFENAIVDTNILMLVNGKRDLVGKAVDMDCLPNKNFPPSQDFWSELRPQGENPWMTLNPVERGILDKIEAIGTPLKDWDISIKMGVKTGYNNAFIIDNETREALVEEDPRSAEIIKPVLRGRDIKRYQAKWAGLWLIGSHNGYKGVPPIDIDDYPVVKQHLHKFYPQLVKRQDKGVTPYNLRNCAYHAEFLRDKLIWMHMSPMGRFAYSDDGVYCNQKTFILIGASLKYLCAVLNSTLMTWMMKNTAVTTGMGLLQWDKFTVEDISIPMITDSRQRRFIDLIDNILAVKATNRSADISKQEVEIDRSVYDLYGLTPEEIAVIEA